MHPNRPLLLVPKIKDAYIERINRERRERREREKREREKREREEREKRDSLIPLGSFHIYSTDFWPKICHLWT